MECCTARRAGLSSLYWKPVWKGTAPRYLEAPDSSEQGNQLSLYSQIFWAPIPHTLCLCRCFCPSPVVSPQLYTKMKDESALTFPDQRIKSLVNTALVQLCEGALPQWQHNPKQHLICSTLSPHQFNLCSWQNPVLCLCRHRWPWVSSGVFKLLSLDSTAHLLPRCWSRGLHNMPALSMSLIFLGHCPSLPT